MLANFKLKMKQNASSMLPSNNTTTTTIRQRSVNASLQITMYIGIGILALPGNFILVYLSSFTTKLKMEGLALLHNLAISDICIIFVGVPFTIANLSTEYGVVTEGGLCQAQGLLVGRRRFKSVLIGLWALCYISNILCTCETTIVYKPWNHKN